MEDHVGNTFLSVLIHPHLFLEVSISENLFCIFICISLHIFLLHFCLIHLRSLPLVNFSGTTRSYGQQKLPLSIPSIFRIFIHFFRTMHRFVEQFYSLSWIILLQLFCSQYFVAKPIIRNFYPWIYLFHSAMFGETVALLYLSLDYMLFLKFSSFNSGLSNLFSDPCSMIVLQLPSQELS